MSRARKPNRIPDFKNEREAAEFWDTHSPLEFPDEFDQEVSIWLNLNAIDDIQTLAERAGVDVATLIRIWVMERLEAVQRKSA